VDVSADGNAAVILAGGAGRRLGGPGKPGLVVAGRPMLGRVLAAVADRRPQVVVGPADLAVPAGVLLAREEPAGGGPAAATGAGLAALPAHTRTVALLAADLPLLTSSAVAHLQARLDTSDVDGVVYVDDEGRRQLLCGVWRATALRQAQERYGGQLTGVAMRSLLDGLRVGEVSWRGGGPPPWFDCDTDQQLEQAREWGRQAMAGTLDDFTVAACAALGLDDSSIDQELVLDLARDVAHGVLRPAAPLSAYLLGLAVGRGSDPREAAAALTALAEIWPASDPA
jgi:molybdopterin-guanine dinucleotide biosynthesis protein A